MTDSPYAIPEEDLVNSARVPLTAQIEEHPERRFFGGDGAGDLFPGGDGPSSDADGE